MNTTVTFTTKGQVVIPVAFRRKYGIAEGTKASLEATPGGLVLRPITPEFIRGLRGALKHLPLLEALEEDRARERDR